MYEGSESFQNTFIGENIGDERERSLWERKTQGDKTALDELFLLHRSLVFEILNKNFRLSYGEISLKPDMEQEGFAALFKAILYFNPSRGLRFSTYAHKVIRTSIFYFLSKMKRIVSFSDDAFVHRKTRVRDSSKLTEYDTFLEFKDFEKYLGEDLSFREYGFEEYELFEWRRSFLAKISELFEKSVVKDKEKLRLIFYSMTGFGSEDFEPVLLRDVASICGFTRQRAARIYSDFLNLIREDEEAMRLLEDL